MKREPISIRSIASLSPLGADPDAVWEAYLEPTHVLSRMEGIAGNPYAGRLSGREEALLNEIRSSRPAYAKLDRSVLCAIGAGRRAVARASWSPGSGFGINMGSSRGATGLFEQYHRDFSSTGDVTAQTSPTTTLGNIASWVAQDLGSGGPEISHSITCSTALHAVLNGVAWIRSGMADKFLVGGSEAPLTPFTIAQMQALKIYSRQQDSFPCRALDLEKAGNTMVLGEGAAVACLEAGVAEGALACIQGVGYATEPLEHGASLSAEASCLQQSMQMALEGVSPRDVDVVVMHAPGTRKGDRAECLAIQRLFGKRLPALTTNKWKIGHTLGASGLFSLELAVLMLQKQRFIGVPYLEKSTGPQRLRTALVNAVGFGGNAVSLLVRTPS